MQLSSPPIPHLVKWRNQNGLIEGPFPFPVSQLDLDAILFFVATGFFWADESYGHEIKALLPNCNYKFGASGLEISKNPEFDWHASPDFSNLDQALKKMDELLQNELARTKGKSVVLGLSGGLDSRCLAAACIRSGLKPVTYSYQFPGGFPENDLGRAIASAMGSSHFAWQIPPHTLFIHIPEMVAINQCMSDFVHPRQAFFLDQIGKLGEVLLLGHFGDVLFDAYKGSGSIRDIALKSFVKPGGFTLAEKLASKWAVEFGQEQLKARFQTLDDRWPNLPLATQYRALKAEYYVARWTAVNLGYFQKIMPLSLPFFSPNLLDFGCRCEESLLQGRLLQIEYIKKYAPQLATIPWQEKFPYDLHRYNRYKTWHHLPYRIRNKLSRLFKAPVQRNWEIQYLGPGYEKLKTALRRPAMLQWVGRDLVDTFLDGFKKSPQSHAHALCMLHVLSEFAVRQWPNADPASQ